jgi:hypothetical protein
MLALKALAWDKPAFFVNSIRAGRAATRSLKHWMLSRRHDMESTASRRTR